MSGNTLKKLNLEGRLLKIAAQPSPPMYIGKYLSKEVAGEFEAKGGSNYEFILLLSGYFNFTWTILNYKGLWGKRDQNGSWTNFGMVGSLITGYCDFATDLPLRFSDGGSIRLTTSYLQARITFVTLKNEQNSIRGVLMMPFRWDTWSVLALTVLVLVACGRMFAVVSQVRSDIDWLVFGALLQKAPRYEKQANYAIHILLQLSWLLGLVLLAAYSGITISSLTANYKVKNLDTVEEFNQLAQSDKITPLIVRRASFIRLFKRYRKDSETYDTILRLMIPIHWIDDGFQLMAQEKLVNSDRHYALIYPHQILNIWCDALGRQYFHLVDSFESTIYTDKYTLGFKENSPLYPHFEHFTKMAIEHGFFVKWYRYQKYRWSDSLDGPKTRDIKLALSQLSVFEDNQVSYQSLQVEHLREHFYLLMGGFAMATLVLVLEICYLYGKQNKMFF